MRFLPNILTILRILLTPVFVFCLLQSDLQVYALGIFFLASLTDWYDGYLARKFGYHTDWGKFLDPLADKVLVLAAFSSFVYLGVVKLWMVMIIISRDFLITGLRSYAMKRGQPMITNLLGKLKTAFQMMMIGMILLFFALQSLTTMTFGQTLHKIISIITQYEVIYLGMIVVTTVTVISGLQYLYENRKSLRQLTSLTQIKNS